MGVHCTVHTYYMHSRSLFVIAYYESEHIFVTTRVRINIKGNTFIAIARTRRTLIIMTKSLWL